MNDAYKQALGRVLEEKRRAQKLSKRRLGMMLDISRLTIRKIENGEANPSLDILLRITQGLGVTLSEVICECERATRHGSAIPATPMQTALPSVNYIHGMLPEADTGDLAPKD